MPAKGGGRGGDLRRPGACKPKGRVQGGARGGASWMSIGEGGEWRAGTISHRGIMSHRGIVSHITWVC